MPFRALARTRLLFLRPTHTTTLKSFSSTPNRLSTAGYGDPPDEKADNHTPTPSSTPDPKPAGQSGNQSGSTDPEVGGVGSGGGKQGAGDKGNEDVSGSEIRETKKIGEEPKKEENGGDGPIGG